ncbi:MAG: ABC-F family ATP-binding cassette domain-containing protein [Candidatus Babeliales bacterium]
MNKKPISINNISFSIHNKICFENFNAQIYPKKRIVIMGINGAGKSTLLKIIQGLVNPIEGTVTIPDSLVFGYVPQTIQEYTELSGGQRFNKELSKALSLNPDILCLDEPTNHLDLNNKRSLIHMLQRYSGTLIIVSHDPDILNLEFDEIWHIEHSLISIFRGNYKKYLKEHDLKKNTLELQREYLLKEKRKLRKLIEQENKRASQSKSRNKNENDRSLLGAMKESGSQTIGKNLKRLSRSQENIQQQFTNNFIHKELEPKFNLEACKTPSKKSIVSINHGSCGYKNPLLKDINLQLQGDTRIAIIGDNGTGKSTLLKAILQDSAILLQGEWLIPEKNDIGYLDQHYSTLNCNLTVEEIIQDAAPMWSSQQVRKHLNDFLFSAQESIAAKISSLSGGEKARLCLAQLAARNPSLLLLDEITNNIDLEIRRHVIKVLNAYSGAMIIVTHDLEFLKELSISTIYEVKDGNFSLFSEKY